MTRQATANQATLRSAHLGRAPRKFLGAVNTPVFRAIDDRCSRRWQISKPRCAANTPESTYGLHGLPTVTDLQNAIADARRRPRRARGAVRARPATTLPLLALTQPGDHVLVTDSVYGPTRRFCELHLQASGRRSELLRPAARCRDRTRISRQHPKSCSSNRRAR